MSRFAANPKWLIYLPPTMSPSETSQQARTSGASGGGVRLLPQRACGQGDLRAEAHGLARGGDRLPRPGRGARRFGVIRTKIGICYTRTGRRFFNDAALETEFLGRVQAAVTNSGLWDELAHRLALPRLRADALVVKSTGPASPAICSDWRGCPRWIGCSRSLPCAGAKPFARNLRAHCSVRAARRDGGAVYRGLSPLLLDGPFVGGFEARALSSSGQ